VTARRALAGVAFFWLPLATLLATLARAMALRLRCVAGSRLQRYRWHLPMRPCVHCPDGSKFAIRTFVRTSGPAAVVRLGSHCELRTFVRTFGPVAVSGFFWVSGANFAC
jgi:hypothetical protein